MGLKINMEKTKIMATDKGNIQMDVRVVNKTNRTSRRNYIFGCGTYQR